MGKWAALSPLSMPYGTVQPGECVELSDKVAIILLDKGAIQPAVVPSRAFSIDLEEYHNGTDNE